MSRHAAGRTFSVRIPAHDYPQAGSTSAGIELVMSEAPEPRRREREAAGMAAAAASGEVQEERDWVETYRLTSFNSWLKKRNGTANGRADGVVGDGSAEQLHGAGAVGGKVGGAMVGGAAKGGAGPGAYGDESRSALLRSLLYMNFV